VNEMSSRTWGDQHVSRVMLSDTNSYMSGQFKFSKPLTDTGTTSGSDPVSVKIDLGHCTTSAGSNVTGYGSTKLKGTLTTTFGSNCSAFTAGGPSTVLDWSGSLQGKWKGFAEIVESSTVALPQIEVLEGDVPPAVLFRIGSQALWPTEGAMVTGSFATSTGSASMMTSEEATAFASACASEAGVKTLTISNGGNVMF
jgi:hypothetical protein